MSESAAIFISKKVNTLSNITLIFMQKKTSPNISPKEISWGADLILRLENLFPKYSFLIKGINFDENKDKQNYFDFLDLLDTYFLIEIKKLTNIETFENYIKMQQV